MTPENSAITARIDARLTELGLSARAACLAAGVGPDVIRDMKRNTSIMPRIDTLEALARPLISTPEYLAYGVHEGRPSPYGEMSVKGAVAAGVWFDVHENHDESTFDPLEKAISPRWPIRAQFGLVVRGTSINRRAAPGSILRCIDLGVTGLAQQDGDLVIVNRLREQEGQNEVTAKVLRMKASTFELWPDSDDERWTQPISPNIREHEGEVVRLVAVCDKIFPPRTMRD